MVRAKKRIVIITIAEIIVKILFFIFSDQYQDKYEYNQTNCRNKEMLHTLILPSSLKTFLFIFLLVYLFMLSPYSLISSPDLILDEVKISHLNPPIFKNSLIMFF